jgi:hypothetical protein
MERVMTVGVAMGVLAIIVMPVVVWLWWAVVR